MNLDAKQIRAIVKQVVKEFDPYSPTADHWISQTEALQITGLSASGLQKWLAACKLFTHKQGRGSMYLLSETILAAMAYRPKETIDARKKALKAHGLTMEDISRMAKPAA